MNNLQEELVRLGLTPNESSVYLAALRSGGATAAEIARLSDMPRTYTYDVLRSLEVQGLIVSSIRGKRTHFSASHPQRLKSLVRRREQALEEALPELEDLYKGSANKATVRFFEGKEGIAAIHAESLEEARAIDVFGEDQEWVATFANWESHVRQVVKRKIRVREIAARIPQTEQYAQLYQEGMQEIRFNDFGWTFKSNVLMWNDKTVFLSYSGGMHAVEIESEPITSTLRVAFEVLWERAKPQS